MNWTKTKPCDNCPFLKGTPIRLSRSRVKEIAGMMLDSQGGTFPCHKTTVFDDNTGDLESTKTSLHCAGALIFAEKQGRCTQMMRIAERLGCYDAQKLMADTQAVASVFSSTKEMLAEVAR